MIGWCALQGEGRGYTNTCTINHALVKSEKVYKGEQCWEPLPPQMNFPKRRKWSSYLVNKQECNNPSRLERIEVPMCAYPKLCCFARGYPDTCDDLRLKPQAAKESRKEPTMTYNVKPQGTSNTARHKLIFMEVKYLRSKCEVTMISTWSEERRAQVQSCSRRKDE